MTSTRRLAIASIAALIGLFLVFQLPYLRPPTVRTISASYDYGFNNSLGILMLAATALFFVAAGFAWMKRPSVIAMTRPRADDGIARRPLWVMTVVSLLLVGVLAVISSDFGFGESTQFVLAMERLSLGQQIYAQFDFYYGPLLAYGPYAIFELGRWLHLDLKTAYFISLALFQWAGLLELRYILNAIDVPSRQRRWMFYAVALATLPFHSGINLILFRFLTPVAGLLLMRQAERLGLGSRCLLMVGLSLLTFGISVEYGVVLAVSLAVYYGGSFVFDRRPSNLLYVAVALLSPVLCYFAFSGLFHTVQLYLLGAWRWPFVVSLPLVAFFVAVFVLALATGSMLNDIRRNYFAIVLCLLAVGSLPAALGRCDPAHLMLNGLTVLMLAWVFAARSMPARFRALFGVLLVVGIGLTNIVAVLRLYAPLYTSLAFRAVAKQVPADTMARLARGAASSLHLDEDSVADKLKRFNEATALDYGQTFAASPTVAAPYQMPDVLAVYLRQSGKSRFLYFKDYSIIASDPEVEIGLRELKSENAQTLVLPVAWKSVVDADRHAALIKLLFFAPYDRAPIANGRVLLQPVVDYIDKNYEQIAATSNFVVMKRLAGH